MTAARRHRVFAAATGWWAIIARGLAVVLALTVAVPEAGLAADFAFHQGHHGPDRGELVVVSDAAPGQPQATDPGLDGHIHCGCHVATALDGAALAPPAQPSRPRYAPVAEPVSSTDPDRLPRPPRA